MRKLVILAGILFLPLAVQAFPALDMTVGGSPLQVIQQTMMQENAYNDFRRFNDANDKPVSMRSDSAQKIKEEYKIQEMKKSPNFKLQSVNAQVEDIPEPKEMQLIEQDGKIIIKPIK